MNLGILVAVSENNVIGNQGDIPWRLTKEDRKRYKEDMNRFRDLTEGYDVIMGRTTYESIPKKFRPLENRNNIVLTSNYDFNPEGVFTAHSIGEALDLCQCDKNYVIGGESVYEQFIPLAQVMEITKIHKEFEGDTFFPEVDWEKWEKINEESRQDYSFLTYQRKTA